MVDCVQFFDKAEDTDACKCKGIVLNTYQNLIKSGVSEHEAIRICVPVLQHHHPSNIADALNVVECWIFEHSKSVAH